jgi:hypothetical protein
MVPEAFQPPHTSSRHDAGRRAAGFDRVRCEKLRIAMIRFEHGKSYIWLFPIFAALFFGGFALGNAAFNNPNWFIITMPLFVAFLLLGELRSGVALDSWWRATYPKGSWQYQALIAWHITAGIAMAIFSYFFI